jgi:hypothetical protein
MQQLARKMSLRPNGEHPSHCSTSIAKSNHWANVEFYFAVAAETSGARVIARLSDGTPLLVAISNHGRRATQAWPEIYG